jgi:hypothetical protein
MSARGEKAPRLNIAKDVKNSRTMHARGGHTMVNCIDIMITLQFLLSTIISTSLALLVFSLPNATAPPTIAANVPKNSPPSRNDTARLTNGALYITVVDVATRSAAAPRADDAATAAAPAIASADLSTRADDVRSGVNGQ